jgi:hypothetical protein
MFKLRFMLRPPTSTETPVFVFELLPVVELPPVLLPVVELPLAPLGADAEKLPTLASPVAGLTVSPMNRAA